ncbi:MAG: DUF4440 domain-containing protein [Saprospiraceae bacterium]|nr:DUF4440 domain-containing protein [Saprospiraceae bacterium]
MKNQIFSFLGLMSVLFFQCAAPAEAPKPIDMAALKTEIQAMEDAFAAGEKAKDAAAVAAYYADDAVSHSRNEEPTVGKAAIQERIQKRMATDTSGNYNVYAVVDLFAEGNMAVEIGSWTEHNAAGEVQDKGHYMSYFEKRNGKYVCVRDMSVSTMPMKKEGEASGEASAQ